MWGVDLTGLHRHFLGLKLGAARFTPAFTYLPLAENKKGLHFCNPLIFMPKMAPPAGLEPATQ
jgi:hypothetical protein